MRHKRIVLLGAAESKYCPVFCYCSDCGTELVGDEGWFKEHDAAMAKAMGDEVLPSAACDKVRAGLLCPACGAPLRTVGEGFFLDLTQNRLIYELQAQRRGNGAFIRFSGGIGFLNLDFAAGYEHYFNDLRGSVELYSEEDLRRLPEEERRQLKWLIAREPADEAGITETFDCMKRLRIKQGEASAETELADFLAESEAQPLDAHTANVAGIRRDPALLKRYLEHLIRLESAVYATGQRLGELLRLQLPVEEEARAAGFLAIEQRREALARARETMRRLPAEEHFASQRPREPLAPARPVMKEPGLFNRRRVLAENKAARRAYVKRKKAYLLERADYEKAAGAYDAEVEELIGRAAEIAQTELDRAETALNEALAAPPRTVEAEKRRLLADETEKARETLRRLIKTKNELYALGVVYEKYRNLVALTSFYEYLASGRCEALEGRDGAYNLYEAEVRARHILSRLDEVTASLDRVRDGQYLICSTIRSADSSLALLSGQTHAALAAIEKMQGNLARIGRQSEVAAYCAGQAAFYERRYRELSEALRFAEEADEEDEDE